MSRISVRGSHLYLGRTCERFSITIRQRQQSAGKGWVLNHIFLVLWRIAAMIVRIGCRPINRSRSRSRTTIAQCYARLHLSGNCYLNSRTCHVDDDSLGPISYLRLIWIICNSQEKHLSHFKHILFIFFYWFISCLNHGKLIQILLTIRWPIGEDSVAAPPLQSGPPWHLGHRNLADCQKRKPPALWHYGTMALRTCSAIVGQNQLQAVWEILCVRATNGRWPRAGVTFWSAIS